jgi:excisionase family DNA binding protein
MMSKDVFLIYNRNMLTAKQAADFLGVTVGTLEVWRSTGRYGIPYVKIGRCVRYKVTDLENFLTSRTFTNTSQAKHVM